MTDPVASDLRERRAERRRALVAWAVFGALSAGIHHLSLQALDVAGFGKGDSGGRQTVMLDLFEPPAPAPPPAPTPKPPEAAKPEPAPPRAPAEEPKPPTAAGGQPGSDRAAGQRPRRPRRPPPRLPPATPEEESNGTMTLRGEYGEPYDPLHPRLEMSDFGSQRFAAADEYYNATSGAPAEGLGPTGLRSPLEGLTAFRNWGGDAGMVEASDFFGEAGDAIQLAINPDRPDILRYVPVDATVLAYLNVGAIHGGPHADGVAALLRVLPEYQSMVGHVEAELLEQADEIYVTSSNPRDRSKTVVLVKHHLDEARIMEVIGRQIALSGGKPDWKRLSERLAVTVDTAHAAVTPWLYLFPEPGVVLVVHRANLMPLVAALEGSSGRGEQPRLVHQLRRLVGPAPPPEPPAASAEAAVQEPGQAPTLFALADSGALAPHLRFFTRALTGTDLGELGAGYLRVTGGERPEVLGGLRLTQPDQARAWSEMMERIAALELARTFDFAWAGREDRLFFRFQLTEPVVDSGLGVFRAWADRYYQSAAIPALPEAGGTAGTVVGTGIHHEPGQAPSVVPRGPDGRPLKDGPDGGTDGDTQDGGAAPPADAGGLPHAAGETE